MTGDDGVHFDDASTPDGMRLYAVGDIHGRHDLLVEMHRRIMAQIVEDRPRDWRLIYLGDYVDRGGAESDVLEFLSRVTRDEPRVLALAGNHDIGLLEFLEWPSTYGLFVNNGGETTAQSYGVELDLSSDAGLLRGHARLQRAIPERHLAFLRGLSLSASFGDFFFCHAGIRPGVPLDEQSPQDLVWIRQQFHGHDGLHPKVVIHGHTPVPAPEICPNRVNLDTGAWTTGRLTAMMFEGRRKKLLEVVRGSTG
ncbi:metallophosphoesterase [Nitratireductor luteus]|uniref:metallophosphoesterase n=1 Tax=Nitratireductor luteus TaxID=2976980 RepID=UPI00224022A0|nr:metallophosphoesterase [Nitratireductor luteus]